MSLERKLKRVSKDFDSAEADFKDLSQEVVKFMDSSNRWLETKYGRGRYGFK
jgi:hypothetical protein